MISKDDILIFLNDAETSDIDEIKVHIMKIKKLRRDTAYEERYKNSIKKNKFHRETIYKLRKSGMTFDEIGKVLSLSGSRCSQLFKSALWTTWGQKQEGNL